MLATHSLFVLNAKAHSDCHSSDGSPLTSSHTDQRALATRATTSGEIPVLRVQGKPNDVVNRLPAHQRMRHTSLAVQHSSSVAQHLHHLTLKHLLFASILPAFEGANPADVAHTGLDIFHMELVFE